MITPAGTECPHYYEDFHRGRARQECRLIERTPNGGTYTPDLCSGCRVPAIARANACTNLVLEGRVTSKWLGLRRSVDVSAFCVKSGETVAEPEIGCGLCHEEFTQISLSPEEE